MADAKLSALVELAAAPAVGDEVYIRDISEAAAAESKRITIANLLADSGTRSTTKALACSDGTADEQTQADTLATGANDEVDLAALILLLQP